MDWKIWERIEAKVEAGRRLSAEEGLWLFDPSLSLHRLGQWADRVCRRLHGQVVYYVRNAHLNPTNVCALRCPICAYSRAAGDPDAFTMSVEEVLAEVQEAVDAGCTEIHIVGGLHPEKPYQWYRDLLRLVHEAFPQLHLKAWTAVEIAWFAQQTDRSIRAILEDLIQVGLGSLPGGGAEIFANRVRQQITPRKIDAQTWLAVHREAHRLGLRSNATMLYGHLETPAERIDHLIQLRQLQDETGGFLAFVPLAFHPARTQLAHLSGPTGLDDLRTMAVSRLILDNIPHLKAYWVSLGVGTAQTALAYGANDFEGTVRQERIHHAAGSPAPLALSVQEICRLIRETGRQPVERDSLYRPISSRPAPAENLNFT
ncbi:MAG: aminofutalosine synthase MqnE [Thermoguttaceae bacterium]|nr:aminofutalosine synthase MqnE [Thermoguttaceae bacterium]MDW8038818.1 aminofutalosine synthase MqnE [Thermoguttaceae bacterium]